MRATVFFESMTITTPSSITSKASPGSRASRTLSLNSQMSTPTWRWMTAYPSCPLRERPQTPEGCTSPSWEDLLGRR